MPILTNQRAISLFSLLPVKKSEISDLIGRDSSEISRKYLQLLCDFSMGSENRYMVLSQQHLVAVVY